MAEGAAAVLAWIAALALAPSQVAAALPLSTTEWWEKITVTVNGDGKPQSCKYESSRRAGEAPDCKLMAGTSGSLKGGVGAREQYAKLTYERRFTPDIAPGEPALHPGDTLLGREVMELAIDSRGKVSGCKIVASSGEMSTDYGCEEAAAELFQPAADRASPTTRQGYMTIMVYGHAEHIAALGVSARA